MRQVGNQVEEKKAERQRQRANGGKIMVVKIKWIEECLLRYIPKTNRNTEDETLIPTENVHQLNKKMYFKCLCELQETLPYQPCNLSYVFLMLLRVTD